MKKIVLFVLTFAPCMCFAQEEFKVTITDALALKTLSISYEHYATEQTSIGISGLFNFEGKNSDFRYNEDRMYTAFVRHYFSPQNVWNFFGELFFSYNQGTDETHGIITEYSDGALGLALGYKYISSGGFTVDIYGGMGRNLFGNDSPIIVPRAGVSIGFQL